MSHIFLWSETRSFNEMMTFIYLQNVTPLAVNQTSKVETMTWDYESQNLEFGFFLHNIWTKCTEISSITRDFDVRAGAL